jgi:hypothetical protein
MIRVLDAHSQYQVFLVAWSHPLCRAVHRKAESYNGLRSRKSLLLTLICQKLPQIHLLLLLFGRYSDMVSQLPVGHHHRPAALLRRTMQA